MTTSDITPDQTSRDGASSLIPRAVLFSDPDRINPQLSPDGRLLAYAAPYEGVMNVWVRPVDDSAPARPVTADRARGITTFTLCAGERLVYAQDVDGDENWRLYLLDLASGRARLVTPERGVKAMVLKYQPAWHPNRMLIAINADNPQLHDVYELDLSTGELTKTEPNPGHTAGEPPFADWLVDADLNVRGGFVSSPDGGAVLYTRDRADGPYEPLIAVPGEDLSPTTAVSPTPDGAALLMTTSLEAPATRLARIDVATGLITTISGDPDYDLTGVWYHPDTLEPIVATYQPDRTHYDLVDPTFADDLERLRALDGGDVDLVSMSGDGQLILAATTAPHTPVRYYLYDRKNGESRFLFPHSDALARYRLTPMKPLRLTARDGLDLHGYLTLPLNAPDQPLPAVVLVHGGPWMRDTWRYHAEAQWLADRGYAVIQVNFRSSTGYGKAHLNAGDRQWGQAMQHDLLDAVHHLADRGVIDPARVGIYGYSYGGYAALCGAALPDNQGVFRCAVSLCGPSDLATLIRAFPPYAKPLIAYWHTRVGHPDLDAEQLREISPLTYAAHLRTPLLIAQGVNDPRVPKSQADQLAAALKQNGIDHQYLVFDDEGHGLTLPGNRETFYAAVETFLATHLGGACEEAGTQARH